MQRDSLKAWQASSHFAGANAAYIEELYEAYLEDPGSVAEQWQQIFAGLPVNGTVSDVGHTKIRDYFREKALDSNRSKKTTVDPELSEKQVRVLQLINAYRFRGHQAAALDPLELWQRDPVVELDPEYHGLTADDMGREFNTGSYAYGGETMKLQGLVDGLRKTYCGHIGAEYMHIISTCLLYTSDAADD